MADLYQLPRGGGEFDRLDVAHYIFRAVAGADYLAPIGTPRTTLEAGSGTGRWAWDLATRFEGSLVVGLDLMPGRPGAPPEYRFVRGSLLKGLPFAAASFDFVHQRFVNGGIPIARWSALVQDLVRVTRPGGWVELAESTPAPPPGPAAERLYGMLRPLGEAVGLDAMGSVVPAHLREYLEHAGAVDVEVETRNCPVGGTFAGDVGYQMAAEFRAMFTHVVPRFRARYGVSEVECMDLVRVMLEEFRRERPSVTFTIAYGRAPLNDPSDPA